MKVTFNNSTYTTEQYVNISADRVAFVLSSEQSIDNVFADAKAATDIYIYNDNDELQGVYNGIKFLALSIIMNENSYISIEFERSNELRDLQEQIFNTDNKVDAQGETLNNLSERVSEITPYTDTKTAYIDDTEVVFNGVPDGALLVSFSNGNTSYSTSREDGVLTVVFAPFDEVVEVTITVQ